MIPLPRADAVSSPVALQVVARPYLLGTLSNKLFVKGNFLWLCWPHHTCKITKPIILNRFRGSGSLICLSHLFLSWRSIQSQQLFSFPVKYHGVSHAFKKPHSQHICNRSGKRVMSWQKNYLNIVLGIILTCRTKSPCAIVWNNLRRNTYYSTLIHNQCLMTLLF